MAPAKFGKAGTLNNKVTRFSRFTWADHPKLAVAIREARAKLKGEDGEMPMRFKIKL